VEETDQTDSSHLKVVGINFTYLDFHQIQIKEEETFLLEEDIGQAVEII